MNQAIEAHGPSVEEAISSGLTKLGVSRTEVEIEIIDEGRRAILGIGGRDAVVRLKKISSVEISPEVEKPSSLLEVKPSPAPIEKAQVASTGEDNEQKGKDSGELSKPVSADDEVETAVSVVGELLSLMLVEAAIVVQVTEPDDLTGKQLPVININGDDLG
ncbi:MAG: Jag N-terminal domain-containing protein, partial [Candidatus Promineifilaceae bacterium]|nr:Jag N-terminal domain-containing protein [Candidatus Promineifilaceae bacterium]